jgi:hypothetical protein
LNPANWVYPIPGNLGRKYSLSAKLERYLTGGSGDTVGGD